MELEGNRFALDNWIIYTIDDKLPFFPDSKLIYENIDHFTMMLSQRIKSDLGRDPWLTF